MDLNSLFLALLLVHWMFFCIFAGKLRGLCGSRYTYYIYRMVRDRLFHLLLLTSVLVLSACEFRLKPFEAEAGEARVDVCRYDRLEAQYLTTSDFSALQQMNTDYPVETSTLIEKVLRIGEVNDPQINNKFLSFYQDSTLQRIISDAESQYANMDDINRGLTEAFQRLKKEIPTLQVPRVYAQIGALDQSIVVGNNSIGISLDKYLGTGYQLYKRYYSDAQIRSMSREYIVPDCLCFYLLSLYGMADIESRPQVERDLHMGKVLWVCNKMLERRFFKSRYISAVERYMSSHDAISIEALLESDDYSGIIPLLR